MARLALLDRDGTLMVHKPYLHDPDDIELLPGTLEGLARLREAGYKLAVVSNQSGVGRGYFGADRVEAVHERLQHLLAFGGAALDGIYFCPHLPSDDCDCRKPATGLALQACRELGATTEECVVVGDSDCDIALGRALGVPTFRLVNPLNAGQATHTLQADADLESLADLLDKLC